MSMNMTKAQRLRKARLILVDVNKKLEKMGQRLEEHQRAVRKTAA